MGIDLINIILPSLEHFHAAGYWIAFLAAIFETVIGIGLILPGSTIILLLGALAARGYFDVGDLIWFAVFGAVIGDNINYYLGKKYGSKWLVGGLWILKTHHVEKTERFMAVHGAKSVFMGRFIPTIKEIVPFLAGSVRMKQSTFMFWNVLGAIGWGFEWVLAGFFFAQSINLAKVWLSRAGLLVAILLIISILFYSFRWMIAKKGRQIFSVVISFWQSLKEGMSENEHMILWMKKYPSVFNFFKARFDASIFSGRTFSIASITLVYLFLLFAGVIEDFITSDPIIAADIRIANLLAVFRIDVLTSIFTWVTLLGKFQVILIFITTATAVLYLRNLKYGIFPLWIVVLGSQLVTFSGKLAFHRPRPPMALYAEHSFSFPSGHATIAVSFYGFIAYLLIQNSQHWNKKVNLFFAAFFLILMIGFSRVYLGVHYISDVWCGYLVGAMWLVACISFLKWLRDKKRMEKPVFFPRKKTLSNLLILLAVFFYVGFAIKYNPPQAAGLKTNTHVVSNSMEVFINEQIRYTETLTGARQEPINCIFLARDDRQLSEGLIRAGWTLTDSPGILSFAKAIKSLILKEPHPTAPISPSFWNARTQDISFAKVPNINWLLNAHHLKVWRTDALTINKRIIYVGMVNANDGFNWGVIPKITPDLDSERESLVISLFQTGKIERPLKNKLVLPQIGKNFIGDPFFSDGQVYTIVFSGL